jgi:hypothetical protein
MLLLRLAMIQTEPVMTRKTISTPKARAQDIVRAVGPAAQMQKEDEVDPYLREGNCNAPTKWIDVTRCDHQPDKRSEHRERYDARFHQRDEVGYARCETGL